MRGLYVVVMIRILLFVISFAASSNAQGYGNDSCGNTGDWSVYEGQCYSCISDLVTWHSARSSCSQLGAHLVTISSSGIQAFLQNFCTYPFSWIGLNDISTEGDFVWDGTAEPVSYWNWIHREPSDTIGDENCVHLWAEHSYKWNDEHCDQWNFSYICQKHQDNNDCQPEPCQNNGTCIDLFNDYQCDCIAGFNGTNCENNIEYCSQLQDPCQNNGTCTDLVNGYKCNCGPGFNGTNCENDIDGCSPDPCQNNGTCTDLVNDYRCDCVPGFNGTNCENDTNDCQAEPCENNGTCTDLVNSFQCDCVAGFNGTNCENNIDECSQGPCQNNGTCTDLVNDYYCVCVPGFNGTNCENMINECLPGICLNNGTCTDLVNAYRCDCVLGFDGTNCENNTDECKTQPCQNNGTCIDLIKDYQCNCTDGFDGTNCTNESHLTKFTMELKIDVTISEDLSSSSDYNTVKSKVHIALTDIYSMITGSSVVIHKMRKGSLIVDFDLIISDDPVSKIQVVDTVYKLVNGLVFVNYSGEVVNVTSASINSSAGTVIITNSTDGCYIMNSQDVCSPGYRCHEFNNYTVACIPIIKIVY